MSYLRYLCLFEYNIQHILFGGWVRACVRACVRVFFFFVYRCLSFVLFHFIIVLSFLYQRQPLITTLVSWNFSWTKTGILTVMEDTSYDHQQTKLCHILQMIKWIYVNFLRHSFSVLGAVVVMIVW